MNENEVKKSLAHISVQCIRTYLEPIWYKWTIKTQDKCKKIKRICENYSKDKKRQEMLQQKYKELTLKVHPDKHKPEWKAKYEPWQSALTTARDYFPTLLEEWKEGLSEAIKNGRTYKDLQIPTQIGEIKFDNTQRSMLAMFAETIILEGNHVFYETRKDDCKKAATKAIETLCKEIAHKKIKKEIQKDKRINAIFLEQTIYDATRDKNTDSIIKRSAEGRGFFPHSSWK